ncbi:hypothetical protein AG1IA_09193 [Rhizoctonia solani AG-1 IA]|uniref:Uncharacterized protein n=1 Tax=Thanatephorus cucumeris (strain AG1-IA) TaxID=983506 RepID=L8WJ87_THACA|nr:hypothetical protein AG1IA_09193 [Rhizoctonia solani AG-1 IA]
MSLWCSESTISESWFDSLSVTPVAATFSLGGWRRDYSHGAQRSLSLVRVDRATKPVTSCSPKATMLSRFETCITWEPST